MARHSNMPATTHHNEEGGQWASRTSVRRLVSDSHARQSTNGCNHNCDRVPPPQRAGGPTVPPTFFFPGQHPSVAQKHATLGRHSCATPTNSRDRNSDRACRHDHSGVPQRHATIPSSGQHPSVAQKRTTLGRHMRATHASSRHHNRNHARPLDDPGAPAAPPIAACTSTRRPGVAHKHVMPLRRLTCTTSDQRPQSRPPATTNWGR
jgi:hypothetical protein